MKLIRLVLFSTLICMIYWTASIAVMSSQENGSLGIPNYVIQCALPYVVFCQISQQFFSSLAVYRFKTRKHMINIHVLFDCILAFFLVSMLFFVQYLYRLMFLENSVDDTSMSGMFDQFVSFFLGTVQLSLLGKAILYSNHKTFNSGGYILAFVICDVELLAMERFFRYYIPFDLNIFLSWAVVRGHILGYTVALGWIIFLFCLLHRIKERKDFLK